MSHGDRRSLTAGLAIAVVLALANLLSLVDAGGPGSPPIGVVVLACLLGATTLGGVWAAWRGLRAGIPIVVGALLINDVGLGLPVFFDASAPPWLLISVVIGIALALVAIGLLIRARAMAPREASETRPRP